MPLRRAAPRPTRQFWIPRTGGPEVLGPREAPGPTPAAGEGLVAVVAAGVNVAEVLARQGLYPDAPPLPAVVGYEVAGAVAAGVTAVAPGDAVVARTRFGGYASRVVVPEVPVFRRPDGMTVEVGAAIPVNDLTAFQMKVVTGSVRRADDVGRRMRARDRGWARIALGVP